MLRPRHYEVMYIVGAQLDDEQLSPIMDKYRKVLEEQGAEVVGAVKWDRRRLAYQINGHREGIFILMTFNAMASAADELSRVMRISDDVIRHLILRPEVETTILAPASDAEREEAEEAPAGAAELTPAEAAAATALAAPEPVSAAAALPATEATPVTAAAETPEPEPTAETSAPSDRALASEPTVPEEGAPAEEPSAPPEEENAPA